GEVLFFDPLSGSSSYLDWTLIAPSGTPVFDGVNYDERGPIEMAETGQYTLTIDGYGDHAGTYQFVIYDVPATVTTPITIGETVDGEIAVPGEVDEFVFDATAGQSLFFDPLSGSSTYLDWTLIAPGGSELFSSANYDDRGPVELTETGQYTLIIDGYQERTSAYQFVIHDVPTPVTTAITIGEVVDGNILVPGQYDIYTFDATAGEALLFDRMIGSSLYHRWTLTTPGGTEIFSTNMVDSAPYQLTETGQYTLVIDGKDDYTEPYRFSVETVSTIGFGDLVSGSLQNENDSVAYGFTATAGDAFYLDVIYNQSNVVDFRLYDPSGGSVFTAVYQDRAIASLPETGQYWLVVYGTASEYSPRDFNFQITHDTSEPPMPPGADLVVTDLTAPTKTVGNPALIEVSWTVTNQGTVATNVADWADRVLINTGDRFEDPYGQIVGQFAHSSLLNPGESYTQTVWITMPDDFYGEFYVEVETDSLNQVYEATSEGNNTLETLRPKAVYREEGTSSGPPALELDIEDGSEFPADSTITLSGQARALSGSANIVFAVDVSGSVAFETGLDANYDGIINGDDDLNNDGSVGDILDVEIGSILRINQMLIDSGIAANIAVVCFALDGTPTDLAPYSFTQAYIGSQADENENGILDLEEAICSFTVDHGPTLFSDMYVGGGTNFEAALDQIDGLIERAPAAERNQVFFLTDGEASTPPDTLLQQFADRSVEFHAFQISGTEISDALQYMADFVDLTETSTGDARIVTDPNDLAVALAGTIRIAGVTINGTIVANLDGAGNFFSPITIEEGPNEFVVRAIDINGTYTTTTITLWGVQSGTIPSIDQFDDVTLAGQLTYEATTFNRQTNTLHATAELTNLGPEWLDAPVVAAFDPFTPASVTLTSADQVDPDFGALVFFDDEIVGGSLGPAESSLSVQLTFDNPLRDRFDFDVTLLSTGNTAPTFVSTPSVEATVGVNYQYFAAASDLQEHTVSFELRTAPTDMTIDPVSGLVEWLPVAGQEGTHQIEVVASDGHGGTTTQVYQLHTRLNPPNRPPVFRSSPTVEIASGTNYYYLPDVFEPDGNSLVFYLDDA
ncbi:MAG: CARDB domain-containing protein, partial [Planctomycetia bacterium]